MRSRPPVVDQDPPYPPPPGKTPGGATGGIAVLRRYVSRPKTGGGAFDKTGQVTLVPVLVSLVVMAVWFQVQSPYFLSARNLSNLVVQVATIGVIALAEFSVLLIGEIDLSLGSVMGAMAAVLATLLVAGHAPLWAAVLIMFLCAIAIGALQGWLIAWVRLSSFIVTLAGLLGWLGLQLYILGSNGSISVLQPQIEALTTTSVGGSPAWLLAALAALWCMWRAWRMVTESGREAGTGWRHVIAALQRRRGALVWLASAVAILVAVAVLTSYRGIPVPGLVLVGLVLILEWFTTATPAGLTLFAVGGNAEAARRAGINIRRVRLLVFVLAAALAAAAALLDVSYEQAAGTLTGGGTLLLEGIGAAVIGGTSLFGGIGSARSALLGAFVLGGIANGLDLTNQSAPVKYMVEGVVVVLAVLGDRLLHRTRSGG